MYAKNKDIYYDFCIVRICDNNNIANTELLYIFFQYLQPFLTIANEKRLTANPRFLNIPKVL